MRPRLPFIGTTTALTTTTAVLLLEASVSKESTHATLPSTRWHTGEHCSHTQIKYISQAKGSMTQTFYGGVQLHRRSSVYTPNSRRVKERRTYNNTVHLKTTVPTRANHNARHRAYRGAAMMKHQQQFRARGSARLAKRVVTPQGCTKKRGSKTFSKLLDYQPGLKLLPHCCRGKNRRKHTKLSPPSL